MNMTAPFHYEQYYHIFNRTNNKEKLFRNQENRDYFLARYKKFICPFVKTQCYALLPNHFHFSIRVNTLEEIVDEIELIKKSRRTNCMNEILLNIELDVNEELDTGLYVDKFIIHQFQRFFISYSKAFNKDHTRSGNLFKRQFKRSVFDPEIRMRELINYIHFNSEKHGLVENFTDDHNHSYDEILFGESEIVNIESTLEYFDSIADFKKLHRKYINKIAA